MIKQIPCFVCGILVEVTDARAIAKLCEEHDTTENRDTMRNTPVHQLLRRLSDSLQQQVNVVAGTVDTTNVKYGAIKQELLNLQAKIDGLSTAPTETAPQTVTGRTNEYGEIV